MNLFKTILLFLFVNSTSFADNTFRINDSHFIHEAFFQETHSNILYQAISQQPPANIIEKIPSQTDPLTIWIPGYWDWDTDQRDFLWVTGVWRKPPPEHLWVPTTWIDSDDNWIRVRGFWKNENLENIAYIRDWIPDNLDEVMSDPPGDDYFWIHGNWKYTEEQSSFIWFDGRWQLFDPNWIYIPAHYVWRPDGYIYIEGYWDWKLDSRGTCFANVSIDPDNRLDLVFTPSQTVDTLKLINRAFLYYPNYLYLFWWHYHFNTSFWTEKPETPYWWRWPKWWCFNVHDQWALWWWFGHPGYPAPGWMTETLAKRIPPPSPQMIAISNRMSPPLNVTPNGVVSQRKMVLAIDRMSNIKVNSRSAPVIPANPNVISQIKTYVDITRASTTLRPTGTIDPIPMKPPKISPEELPDVFIVGPNAVKLNVKETLKTLIILKQYKLPPPNKPAIVTGQPENRMYENQKLKSPIEQVHVPNKPILPRNQQRLVNPPSQFKKGQGT